MPFPLKGSQALYLYNFKWDATKDNLILTCLIEKIDECRPSPPHLCPNAVIHAMLALNSQLKANVSYNEVEGRVDFLHERYVCFKHLCKAKGTHYEEKVNVIHASDEVWQRLFVENDFFRAYYHEGEPAFILMCNVFGIHDVKRELSHTLIVIEDSSTVKKRCDSSDDEVTSPIPKPPACKKLFPDDACSSIAAPSVLKPVKGKVSVPWKSLKNKFCRPNAIPIKKKGEQDPDSEYAASSCASTSPFK